MDDLEDMLGIRMRLAQRNVECFVETRRHLVGELIAGLIRADVIERNVQIGKDAMHMSTCFQSIGICTKDSNNRYLYIYWKIRRKPNN